MVSALAGAQPRAPGPVAQHTAVPARAADDEAPSGSVGAEENAEEPPEASAEQVGGAQPDAAPEPAPTESVEPVAPAAWATAPEGAPPLGQPPPPPEALAPESARRAVELVPQSGPAFAHCRAGDVSSNTCEGVGTGAGVGFIALWRVTGRLAWGGELDLVGLGYEPPERLELRDASAGAAFLGVAGRFYAFDEGDLDPYVELAIGGGAVGTQATDATNTTYEQTGAGPALQLGLGFDFFLGTKLRLGPAVSLTHVFVDKIRRCEAGGQGECQDVSRSEHGYMDTLLRLNLRLTIMLGPEL